MLRSVCPGMPYDHQIWSSGSLTDQHYIAWGFSSDPTGQRLSRGQIVQEFPMITKFGQQDP